MTPSLIVLERSLSSIRTQERNARTHTDAQVAEIAASIQEFGFVNPILLDEDGLVIAGHGRLAAARLLGLVGVPTIEVRGLTDLQRRQLAIADNRIALNAGWDTAMLRAELTDLRALGAELKVLGFSPNELTDLLGDVPQFGPAGAADQSRIDRRDPITCPHCGESFVPA